MKKMGSHLFTAHENVYFIIFLSMSHTGLGHYILVFRTEEIVILGDKSNSIEPNLPKRPCYIFSCSSRKMDFWIDSGTRPSEWLYNYDRFLTPINTCKLHRTLICDLRYLFTYFS